MQIDSISIAGRPGVYNIEVNAGQIYGLAKVEGAASKVLIPTFGDVHVHLDKTYLIDRCPERVDSLEDAIRVCSKAMVDSTFEDIKDRAGRALRESFFHGICHSIHKYLLA